MSEKTVTSIFYLFDHQDRCFVTPSPICKKIFFATRGGKRRKAAC